MKKNEEPIQGGLHAKANTDVQNLRRSLNEFQLNGSNSPTNEEQQYSGEPIAKDANLNFNNLILIDEKLNSLADCLKKSNIVSISQMCSDWWELTDEDEYTVNNFAKAFNDEKAKRELKQLICLEILSIAIVNYFTSSPEIFRPTNIQMNQVRSLL